MSKGLRKWTGACLDAVSLKKSGLILMLMVIAIGLTTTTKIDGQQVKQLKKPKELANIQANAQAEDVSVPTAEPTVEPILPSSRRESYSIIIENKIGPDGKQVRTKKVWQNGVLVEEKEEVIAHGSEENTSITLPDGETAPGMILRSERFGDNSMTDFESMDGSMSGTPFEMMQQLHAKMQQQQQAQAQAFREFCEKNGLPFHQHQFSVPPRSSNLPSVQPSEYWIGTSVQPIPVFLADQLNLPLGKGLLIVEIIPDSPASLAGLKKYDILLKIGDKEIAEIADIGTIVDRDKEKVQPIEIFRKGEKMTVELTPTKRPVNHIVADPSEVLPGDRQSIRVVRPGLIVPQPSPDKILSKEIQP